MREFEGAKVGADLLDLRDKVRRLDIFDPWNSLEPSVVADPPRLLASVDEPAQLSPLIELLLAAPVVAPSAQDGGAWYVLQFLMRDGTHVSREFRLGAGIVYPGIDVSREFVAEIARIVNAGR